MADSAQPRVGRCPRLLLIEHLLLGLLLLAALETSPGVDASIALPFGGPEKSHGAIQYEPENPDVTITIIAELRCSTRRTRNRFGAYRVRAFQVSAPAGSEGA